MNICNGCGNELNWCICDELNELETQGDNEAELANLPPEYYSGENL